MSHSADVHIIIWQICAVCDRHVSLADDRQMSDGGVAPTHPIQRSAHSRRALSPSPRVLRLAPLASSETMSELLTEEMNATSSDSSELSNEESDDSFSPNVTSSLSQHGHNHRVITLHSID